LQAQRQGSVQDPRRRARSNQEVPHSGNRADARHAGIQVHNVQLFPRGSARMKKHSLSLPEFILLCAFLVLIAAKYANWLLGFLS